MSENNSLDENDEPDILEEFDIQISDYDTFEAFADDFMKLFVEEFREGFEGNHGVKLEDYDDFGEFIDEYTDEFFNELRSVVN